jgi:hypothetical protein
LRAKFTEFRIDEMDDGVIGVQPLLRHDPVQPGRDLYREWLESGDSHREPTREELAEFHGTAEEPIWARGDEEIRPPLRALTVSTGERRHSQEYHPLSINCLRLPPLRLAA